MIRKLLPCLLIALSLFWTAGAQDAKDYGDKAQRRARLLAAVEEDAEQLRLPENRAFINAKIAALLWKTDEKLARTRFRTAIAELIAAQEAADANKNRYQLQDLKLSQNIRPQIINLMAGLDAELALDALRSSRPAAIAQALASAGTGREMSAGAGDTFYAAQNEITLEQRLIRMAAEQRPVAAASILKDTVRRRLSAETLNLLLKISQQDQAAAAEIGNEVLDRLANAELLRNDQPNYELLNLSTSIVTDFLKERQPDEKFIAFDESRVRRLAQKLIDTYLGKDTQFGWIPFDQLEPIAKRFLPGAFEKLRNAAKSPRYRGFGYGPRDPEYRKLIQSDPTAEALILAAKDMEPDSQREAYLAAANKLSDNGHYQQAVALLADKLDGDSLENGLGSIKWRYANHLMQEGQFDSAESLMLEMSEVNRVSSLISLATKVYNSDQEKNRSRAAAILIRARAFLPDRPETQNDMSHLFALLNAMAEIDTVEAFRQFEPMVGQLNELVESFAVVNSFQGVGIARQGEFILVNGFNFGVYVDPNMIRSLAQREPNRTMALIDGFSQRELRIMLRINLLETLN